MKTKVRLFSPKTKKPSDNQRASKKYPGSESNRYGRNGHRILSPACLPIPPPGQTIFHISKNEILFLRISFTGAENETRTRDPNLGKVVLYQLSYFRISKLYSLFSPTGCIAVSNTGANIYRFF